MGLGAQLARQPRPSSQSPPRCPCARPPRAAVLDLPPVEVGRSGDQFGHANSSMTADVYYGRKVAATGAAGVLGAVDPFHDA